MKTLLFDIEGTTTDIKFVQQVLFPYAYERLEDYVRLHSNHPAIEMVREILAKERGQRVGLSEVISALKFWITTDRKIGPLKTLQGEIWQSGYLAGAFQGHVYPDVKPAWEAWQKKGHRLAIYSSGSVAAQKLIFGYSSAGDLTGFLSHFFDTQVGGKREVASYLRIAQELKTEASEVVFFSDIKAELDQARLAGMQTVHIFREERSLTDHNSSSSLAALDFP